MESICGCVWIQETPLPGMVAVLEDDCYLVNDEGLRGCGQEVLQYRP